MFYIFLLFFATSCTNPTASDVFIEFPDLMIEPKIIQFIHVVNWTMKFLLREQGCSSCWVTVARKAALLHL